MYFNKFPKIDYKFSNNQTLPVVDVFRKVSFSQESLQNSNIFIDTINGTGKKPEVLAYEYYNNPEFSWLLFMANQTINPSLDWPIDYERFNINLNTKYSGSVFYLTSVNGIQSGDVAMVSSAILDPATGTVNIVTVDTGRFLIITDINQEFRYFAGASFGSVFIGGNFVIFLRKNTDGKYRPVEENGTPIYREIRSKESYKNAPKYFKYGNLLISPYRIFNQSNMVLTDYTASFASTEIYEPEDVSDTQTLFNTVLWAYMTKNPLPTGLEKVTLQQDAISEQDAKCNIKVIKPEVIYDLIDLFDRTINSNSIGRAQKIELFI